MKKAFLQSILNKHRFNSLLPMKVFSLIFLLGFAFASSDAEIKQAYEAALEAVETCDVQKLDELCYTHADDLNLAIKHGLVDTSLLFKAVVLEKCPAAYPIFARYGVEFLNLELFKRNWNGASFDHSTFSVEKAQELMDLRLLELEDFWLGAVEGNNRPLWSFLLHSGANLDQTNEIYGNLTGLCIWNARFDLLSELLEAGVDVNKRCSAGWLLLRDEFSCREVNTLQFYINTIHSTCEAPGLAEIAARTENIFSFLMPGRVKYSDCHVAIIGAEIERRLREGADLNAFDVPDAFGRRVLDKILVLPYARLKKVGKLLYVAGFISDYPLAAAAVCGDLKQVRELIQSGNTTINELIFNEHRILSLFLTSPFFTREMVEYLLESGATVHPDDCYILFFQSRHSLF